MRTSGVHPQTNGLGVRCSLITVRMASRHVSVDPALIPTPGTWATAWLWDDGVSGALVQHLRCQLVILGALRGFYLGCAN